MNKHMTLMLRSTYPILLCFATVAAPFGGPAFAQTAVAGVQQATSASHDTQLLKAMLDEIRELRLSLQKQTLKQFRSLVILKEIEWQQSRTEALAQQLDQLRATVQDLSIPNRYEREMRELETNISQTSDPQARAQLSQVYEDRKRFIERQKGFDQQDLEGWRERERELDARLRTEQNRYAELKEQLSAIERDLSK